MNKKEEQYNQLKERRKSWFWKLFLSGGYGIIATFVTIFSVIEKIEIPTFKIGVIIVLGIYCFIVMVSIGVWAFYSFKMKQIRDELD